MYCDVTDCLIISGLLICVSILVSRPLLYPIHQYKVIISPFQVVQVTCRTENDPISPVSPVVFPLVYSLEEGYSQYLHCCQVTYMELIKLLDLH